MKKKQKLSKEQIERNRLKAQARRRMLAQTLPGSRIEDNPDYHKIIRAIQKEKGGEQDG